MLTGERSGTFTQAYENLRPFVRWNEWGPNSISHTVSVPGKAGADSSPLVHILDDSNHGATMKLSAEDRRRIFLWLDSNAPFFGTYEREVQAAQLRGDMVLPPVLQ